MKIQFFKYQGTGNDFIMIDDRSQTFDVRNKALVEKLCNRRFGIGADGLILLREQEEYDFEMIYFNSDGRISTMCGNGGRCIVRFAYDLKIIGQNCTFLAIDGPHEAAMQEQELVSLKMINVDKFDIEAEAVVMNTGSPHYVKFVNEVEQQDIVQQGRQVRYSEKYFTNGINVNFVELIDDHTIKVRTYERGVEDETYSCGTGVVAAALSTAIKNANGAQSKYKIISKGGDLEVKFSQKNRVFKDIWLTGPAEKVFEGFIEI